MDASMIALIVNILFGVFAFLGFLWGLGRGVKKSLLRILTFIIFVVIAALCAPLLAKTIIAIELPIGDGGSMITIENYVANYISSIPAIAENAENVAGLTELILSIPLMLANVVLFVVLVWISKFISWIVFLIVNKIITSKKTKKQQGEPNEKVYSVKDGNVQSTTVSANTNLAAPKEKKHRFLGGLVSACQAIILLFLTLLPVSGLVSLVSKYANETVSTEQASVQMADENSNVEYTETAKMIREALGTDILLYVDSYQSSILVKTFSVGGFEDKVFDALTTVKVNGEKVVLSKELNVVSEVYNTVAYFTNIDYTTEDWKWENFDFEKLEKAINTAFDSGLVKSVGQNLINSFIDMTISTLSEDAAMAEENADLIQFLTDMKQSFIEQSKDNKMYDILKSDILAFVGACKVACQSGFVDLVTTQEVTVLQVLDKLAEVQTNQTKTIFERILNQVFSSTTLKNAIVSVTNIAYGELEKALADYINEENGAVTDADKVTVTLDRVSKDLNWTNFCSDIATIFVNGINIYHFVEEYTDLEERYQDEELTKEVLKLDYAKAINSVGAILDKLYNFSLLVDTKNGQHILNQVYDNLAKVNEYNNYINFNALKSLDWKDEVGILIDGIDAVKPMIDGTVTSYQELDYETISAFVEGLFDSSFSKAVKISVFNELQQDPTEDNAEMINDIVEFLTKDNTSTNPTTKVYPTLSDTKDLFIPYVNVLEIVADAGIIDLIADALSGGEAISIQTIISDLCAIEQESEKTYLALVFDEVFESDLTNVAIRMPMNEINKILIQLVDSTYDEDRASKGYDFKAQKADLIAIIESFVPLMNIEIGEGENMISVLQKEENQEIFQAFITALETNANREEGKNFFKDAYDAFINAINEQMQQSTDLFTELQINTENASFAEEFDDLTQVIEKAGAISEATSVEDAIENHASDIADLLDTLKGASNENGEGSISEQLYDAAVNYITNPDNATGNAGIADIQSYITTNYNGVDPSEWNWADILVNYNAQ